MGKGNFLLKSLQTTNVSHLHATETVFVARGRSDRAFLLFLSVFSFLFFPFVGIWIFRNFWCGLVLQFPQKGLSSRL